MGNPMEDYQAAIDAAEEARANAHDNAEINYMNAVDAAKQSFAKATRDKETSGNPTATAVFVASAAAAPVAPPQRCPKCGDTSQKHTCSKCGHVLSVVIMFLLLLFGGRAYAQNPAPSPAPGGATQTLQISIGAQALGLGTATAGTDVVAKVQFKGALSLRSDNILVPSINFQLYAGGIQYNLPTSFLAKTNFSSLQGYVSASIGADRIVPASGPSTSHIAFLAGGGLNWQQSANVIMNIVEVKIMHAPGNPSGVNVPVVSGGISLFF